MSVCWLELLICIDWIVLECLVMVVVANFGSLVVGKVVRVLLSRSLVGVQSEPRTSAMSCVLVLVSLVIWVAVVAVMFFGLVLGSSRGEGCATFMVCECNVFVLLCSGSWFLLHLGW